MSVEFSANGNVHSVYRSEITGHESVDLVF